MFAQGTNLITVGILLCVGRGNRLKSR